MNFTHKVGSGLGALGASFTIDTAGILSAPADTSAPNNQAAATAGPVTSAITDIVTAYYAAKAAFSPPAPAPKPSVTLPMPTTASMTPLLLLGGGIVALIVAKKVLL